MGAHPVRLLARSASALARGGPAKQGELKPSGSEELAIDGRGADGYEGARRPIENDANDSSDGCREAGATPAQPTLL